MVDNTNVLPEIGSDSSSPPTTAEGKAQHGIAAHHTTTLHDKLAQHDACTSWATEHEYQGAMKSTRRASQKAQRMASLYNPISNPLTNSCLLYICAVACNSATTVLPPLTGQHICLTQGQHICGHIVGSSYHTPQSRPMHWLPKNVTQAPGP